MAKNLITLEALKTFKDNIVSLVDNAIAKFKGEVNFDDITYIDTSDEEPEGVEIVTKNDLDEYVKDQIGNIGQLSTDVAKLKTDIVKKATVSFDNIDENTLGIKISQNGAMVEEFFPTLDSVDAKLDKPSDTPSVGKVLKVKSVNEDGTFVCEWADDEAGSGDVSDVKVNENSVVVDGVAKLVFASGIYVDTQGRIVALKAGEGAIDRRTTGYLLTTDILNYAVKGVLTDGKAPSLTEAQQTAAQTWLGIFPMSEEGY